MENVDTTTVPGKSLLPIYIEEKLVDKYHRKDPNADKERILGEKKVNYGDFIDNAGISSYIKSLYADKIFTTTPFHCCSNNSLALLQTWGLLFTVIT